MNVSDNMIRVHAILEEYLAIHDAIFKFSWRKAIPIPGIFKPIDCGRHFSDLGLLASELERVSRELQQDPDAPDVVHPYAGALFQTIEFLRGMCGRLYEKSQGNVSAYPMSDYNSDVQQYKQLLAKYRALGVAVNRQVSR